jgi:hypothetical protein
MKFSGFNFFKIYVAIVFINMFYVISTYECDEHDKKYNGGQCMGESIGSAYFQSIIWPFSIVYKVTH